MKEYFTSSQAGRLVQRVLNMTALVRVLESVGAAAARAQTPAGAA